MSFEKTTTRQTEGAGEIPHEQERGEAKSRPGAREPGRKRQTTGRNVQQEKKGKVRATAADGSDTASKRSGRQITKPLGSGKKPRRPRTGKSAHAGSRRSRSVSNRKNSRSSATAP
jgi:hypothetical protein